MKQMLIRCPVHCLYAKNAFHAENAEVSLLLSAALDLPTAKVEARNIQGKDFLLVERYDRVIENGQLVRLHQEDFCQAMAISSDMKYQNEGGPSLKQCFDLLREMSSVPVLDLQTLLNTVIFNFLIGNNDAHGKNFSLLYHVDASIRLAPLYDLVCTAQYPELSPKMAMKLGGEYRSDRVAIRHFEKLADEVGLAKPMVKKRVQELAEKVIATLDELHVSFEPIEAIKILFKGRCEKVLRWF
jgi:serine/threonine-protein kinase HipA